MGDVSIPISIPGGIRQPFSEAGSVSFYTSIFPKRKKATILEGAVLLYRLSLGRGAEDAVDIGFAANVHRALFNYS